MIRLIRVILGLMLASVPVALFLGGAALIVGTVFSPGGVLLGLPMMTAAVVICITARATENRT